MTQSIEEERACPELEVMTRTQVVGELMNFPGAVQLDFTHEFIAAQSLDQLKHILAAARMHISLKSDQEKSQPVLGSA